MMLKMSLSKKLAAMLALPILTLVVLTSMELDRRRATDREMEALVGLTQVAKAANQLSGALHRERSVTAASVEAAGTASLQALYPETDRLVRELADEVATHRTVIDDSGLGEVVDGALISLEELSRSREATVSGNLSSAEAVSAYNRLTADLLPVVTAVSKEARQAEVASMLLSLDLLARFKEAADLERGALNMALSMDFMSQGLAGAVESMSARQEITGQLFLDRAPAEIAEAFREQIDGELGEELSLMRSEALGGVGADSLAMDSTVWWSLSSRRLDAIAELENDLADLAVTTASRLQAEASRAAWLGGITMVVVVALAILLSAFIARQLNRSLRRASSTIADVVQQISASVQVLTSATGETAASVAQTSTTVDELRQTSESAARKARETSEAAEQSRGQSERAHAASNRGVAAMENIRTQVEDIAERIVNLSERNSQIREIVQNVNAIAEQSNLLAVNASIEAAKAGEHGRGFAVVAAEVKSLAERSKEATDQIRTILAEIQRSSNEAVMVTEQGVKRADEGSGLIEELGSGIETLAVAVQENSDTAQQIALISNQQLTGIEQITEALKAVEEAASDNAAGAQQLQSAADQLVLISGRIATIVEGREPTADGR